jgi:DNA-directed RNA polymerase specialized sigma24 family protein
MEEQVSDLLPLAAKIAREFSNIPGLPHAGIDIAAQEALARAALALDPAKGDFTAYAAAAMRNVLRYLHERQSRHHRHHLYDLDLPATIDKALVRNPKARFPDAGKLLAALPNPRP